MFIQTNSVIKSNSSSLSVSHAGQNRTGPGSVYGLGNGRVDGSKVEKNKKDKHLVTESLQSPLTALMEQMDSTRGTGC